MGQPEEESTDSVKQYTIDLCQRLNRINCFAHDHLKLTSDRMKQRYDLLQEGQLLAVGDAVWLHGPQQRKGVNPKLQRPWKGSYLIKKINDLIYRIRLGPHTKPKVYIGTDCGVHWIQSPHTAEHQWGFRDDGVCSIIMSQLYE